MNDKTIYIVRITQKFSDDRPNINSYTVFEDKDKAITWYGTYKINDTIVGKKLMVVSVHEDLLID